MLHRFLHENRRELIERAAEKAAARPAASWLTAGTLPHGVPLLLAQLEEALQSDAAAFTETSRPGTSPIGQSAGRHGADLLRQGFSVGDVVHCYGDVCQAITDLAMVTQFTITTDEFRTMNRSLDDAIASAVTGYARETGTGAPDGEPRDGGPEQRRLLCSAGLAWGMLVQGSVGVGGNTGGVMTRSLESLRRLYNREHPETAIPPSLRVV